MKDGAHVADTQPDTGALWTTVLEALARDGVPMPQRAFLQGAKIKGVLEQTVLVAVSNDFAKQVLEQKVRERVIAVLSRDLGPGVSLAVTVDPALEDPWLAQLAPRE